ncbi:MAG: hypothetical protein ACFFDF_05275 [Candidatus Odinarchaeota archaeon]
MPYIRYSDIDLKQKALNENWRGQGSPESPYIIEALDTFSDESIIKDSSLHIIMRSCKFKYLTLNSCQNLKFEGCIFEVLQLLKCSNIFIDNCSINMRLDIIKSHNSLILKSSIEFLKIARSLENRLKSCSINQISNYLSKANKFEDIKTTIQNFSSIVVKESKKILLATLIFPFIGIGLLSIAITRFGITISVLQLWLLIGGIFLMIFFEIIIALALYLDHKKMKKYPPNTIK